MLRQSRFFVGPDGRGRDQIGRLPTCKVAIAVIAAFGSTFVVPLSTSPPASTTEAAVRKSVDTDYTLLRRGPRSYVIGTAYRGWTVDVQGEADAGYR